MAESRVDGEQSPMIRNGVDKWLAGIVLLLGVWGLAQLSAPENGSWAQVPGTLGRVRILRFRASVGALIVGQKAQLCYGVENARSVRIAPVAATVDPSPNRCMEIGPRHTTHYTIMAVGYDGSVATRSLTLAVQAPLPEVPEVREFALAMPASTTAVAAAP
ncbi:MAG: hypothetical protein JO099_18605 [Acidobacteriia bacterium]|nr:hypothetical protein [Terriglobia bacterium]